MLLTTAKLLMRIALLAALSGCQAMNKSPTPEYMQTQSVLRLCRRVVIYGGPWMSLAQEELARRGENPRLCYDRVNDV